MKHTCPNCGYEYGVESKQQQPDPAVKSVIIYYANTFKNKFGAEPMIKWGACGTVAKRLLKTYQPEQIKRLVESYLNSGDDFLSTAGYPFLLLPSFIQKQAVQKTKKPSYDGLL